MFASGFVTPIVGGKNTVDKNYLKKKLKPAEIEDFEERAAIMEYDGGLSREEAEKQAFLIVLKRREKGLYDDV